jgi:hypothetical protein
MKKIQKDEDYICIIKVGSDERPAGQKDIDEMLETVAVNIAERLYIKLTDSGYNPVTDSKQIRFEMLLGTPDKLKKFTTIHETKIVEVKG